MTHPEISAVFFDLDETLIKTTKSFEQLSLETFDAFASHLAPTTRTQYWELFWHKALDTWFMMIDGALPAEHARIYAHINTLRALNGDERLAAPMLEYAENLLVASTVLLEDTLPVLTRLRAHRIPLGIITNGFTQPQRAKLARHGLEPLVDFIVVSGEVGVHKPNPGIFEHALALAHAAPERAIYVGDQPEVDIAGAQRAGLQAVLISGPDPVQDLPRAGTPNPATPRITRLAELLPLLGLDA
ncbi:MAG: HAD family hydrolase [Candidatus Hydrogenedentes bacterium]|nr:HAD family hydrolase [Candidatus Hydrogenedentota bacterium]